MSVIRRDISLQYPGAAVGLDPFGGYALFNGDGHAGHKPMTRIFVKLPGLFYGHLMGESGEGIQGTLLDQFIEPAEILLSRSSL